MQTISGLAKQMVICEGCLKADIYVDIEDKDILYLTGEWSKKKDLEDHVQSKSYAVLLGLETLLVESLGISHAIKYKPNST